MGKNDFLTPKAIGNRIKAKGLGKLRWYCQLCQKQCRDENGFKCHQTSESHLRQMELFGQSASRVVSGYSEEFEKSFMEHLKRAHPFSRVAAKVVYNEYINDKNHVHMNATQWLTLTSFVKYLGKEGKCKVDETPKGWFILYIHKDTAQEIEEEKHRKRQEAELEEEDRHQAAMLGQMERARKFARTDEGPSSATDLQRDEEGAGQPIVLSLLPQPAAATAGVAEGGTAPGQGGGREAGGATAASVSAARAKLPRPIPAAGAFADDEDAAPSTSGRAGASSAAAAGGTRPTSKLDALMQKEREAKQRDLDAKAKRAKLDYWLHPGVVVKVMSRELEEHGYYKQKGVVERVVDRYAGEIAMMGSGDVIRVDQAQLETVIPAPGGAVMIVNGLYRGARGTLLNIDTAKFQAQVRLSEGSFKGRDVWQDYEEVCKLA